MAISKYPNILILMSDEHRADITGFSGNSVVRTPVLDELARTGVVFSNTYTPSPICVPARQCLMSGQFPKTCGCEGSWMDLAPGYHTFARRFSQFAYRTVCSGKLHHIGVDQMQGWSVRLAPDAEVYDKYCDGLIREEMARCVSGKAKFKGSDEDIVKAAIDEEGRYQRFDLHAAEEMRNYIQTRLSENDARPHLLKLSFIQPHYPYRTDPERFKYYYDQVPIFQEESCDHPVLSLSQDDQPVNVSAEEIRRATATYYGMIDTIDTLYGQALDTLKECGENLDDWIIVYLSDHGEMLGQHGIWEKARMYEGSVRVPLIIRYPKRFKGGTVVTQNVNLCDLFATLCDLAEIPAQPGLDSRTLVPLMEGNTENWNNETVSQIRRQNRDHVMIKRDDLKYQYYGDDFPEVLFDLAKDPGETENRIGDPAYTSLISQFRQRLGELGYGPNQTKSYVNAGYSSGVEEAEIPSGFLWKADSNPWLDPL